MDQTPQAAPLFVTALLVAAFVLVVFFPALNVPDPAEGDPVVTLVLEDVGPDEHCVEAFDVGHPYERISLNYRFGTAIKPRIALEDPNGTRFPAQVVGSDLVLEIERPEVGEWTLDVWAERSPGIAAGIHDGIVFVLAFPPREDHEAPRPSLCSGTLSQS